MRSQGGFQHESGLPGHVRAVLPIFKNYVTMTIYRVVSSNTDVKIAVSASVYAGIETINRVKNRAPIHHNPRCPYIVAP